MIGRALAARLVAARRDVVLTSRSRVRETCATLLTFDLARDAASWTPPRAKTAFLCAAITSQEQCRRDPALSRAVNVDATLQLAEKLVRQGTHVVFPSTNLVLSGLRPFQAADDPYSPQTEYARQKVEVEQRLRQLPGTCIVRFTKVLDRGTPLLCEWREALERGEAIHPFADMPMAPVTVQFAVDALISIAAAKAEGIFHVSAAEDITYAAAGQLVAEHLGAAKVLVHPVTVAESGIAIEHMPRHTTLDTTRLQDEFGLQPPCPREAIELGMETTVCAVPLSFRRQACREPVHTPFA
jgi:dTDP-4-dehydrorhamnose reductase